jgi:hypothetical protein
MQFSYNREEWCRTLPVPHVLLCVRAYAHSQSVVVPQDTLVGVMAIANVVTIALAVRLKATWPL